MEYPNENSMIGRDIPPVLQGRQNVLENPEHNKEDSGASCPWIRQCMQGWGLADHPLAMVYAPCQGFHNLYDPETALVRGTLFSELDLPLEAVEGQGSTSACTSCRGSSRKSYM